MGPQVEYLRSTFEKRVALGEGLSEAGRVQLRSVKDHAQLLVEKVDLAIEQAASIRDAYAVSANMQANRTMSRLTVISVVFLPLTFLTGFFGMNFTQLPYSDARWLVFVLLSTVLAPVGVLFWIKRTGLDRAG
jgi:magnesium transporter